MECSKLEVHFVLIPMLAQGHLLPMVDVARLLAQRNNVNKVTIITTPLNALRVQPSIDSAEIQPGSSPINFHYLKFPNLEAGLPEGCETLDTIPSMDLRVNFAIATFLLQKPLEEAIEELLTPPSLPICIIHDKYLSIVPDVANKFEIPRITFDGSNCLSLLCNRLLYDTKVADNLSPSESFFVPGLPHRIEFKRYQLHELFSLELGQGNMVSDFRDKIWKDEEAAYGVIVNSFDELEEEYAKEYTRMTGSKVWCIGPVSLSNKDIKDKAQRGKMDSKEVQAGEYLKWLDSWPERSVIYACFGSLDDVRPGVLMELGLGLEASKRPFIWVLRDAKKVDTMNKLLNENGLEERVKGRGLVIRGWVPQLLILSHKSIGLFVTHCGWNSTVEGICSDVPLVTFPLFADQFYNDKVVVELMKTGVRVGVESQVHFGVEGEFRIQVMEAIEKVMGEEDEESKRIRERARDYGEKAKRAMEEGGSSYRNLSLMIEDMTKLVRPG